jgi:peroxiredoxin family protein/rhodanese-related sulfurtransferase/TusA-related sulfurtransferase
VYTLRSIPDMDAIKKAIDEKHAQNAVIVGGGYIGLEMAEALVERGVKTTLVELLGQVMGTVDPEMAVPLHQELKLHGVDLRLKTSVTRIQPGDKGLDVELSTGDQLKTDMVVLAVGVRPETALAKAAGLDLGDRGGIKVNAHMQTSVPDIYAVGDAVEVTDLVGKFETLIPLAGPANRQGRIAADNICGIDSVYKHTQGTAICKVFGLAVATTGMNEKNLTRAAIPYEKIYVHPSSHAGYYPGATPISLKLLFDPQDGTILGAQAVGAAGLDKRIDIIATAIRAGLTVHDLEDLELSYAPPYGSARDPVNYAGFVAGNVLDGRMPVCHAEDALHPAGHQKLLDVRTAAEVEAGTLPGAVHIPLEQLRDRLGDLDKDSEWLAFCQVGLRGYLATRILLQNGFKARNITGGYKTLRAVAGLASENPSTRKETRTEMNANAGQENPTESLENNASVEIVKTIDACGLQCPGPILGLKAAVDAVRPGQAVRILTSDPGFSADIAGWCESTGHRLVDLHAEKGTIAAVIEKGAACPVTSGGGDAKKKTIVVFSGDFDKAMAAFIIANGAASMGSEVTLFFTFWGLNILRRPESVPVEKTFIEKMFGWMMPRGAGKVKLSKMNMGGMGTWMMQGIMKKKNVLSLPELIDKAQQNGVRLVACTMTMDLMGIRKEELIDGIEEGGVAAYLNKAEAASVNLFI